MVRRDLEAGNYERNKSEYDLQIFRLQKENLQLANKQLKRYWLYTIISFCLGVSSTFITHTYTKDTKDTQILSYKIDSIKAVVKNLEDSIRNVRVYNTKQMGASNNR